MDKDRGPRMLLASLEKDRSEFTLQEVRNIFVAYVRAAQALARDDELKGREPANMDTTLALATIVRSIMSAAVEFAEPLAIMETDRFDWRVTARAIAQGWLNSAP